MKLVNVYFDESGTHDGSKFLTLAGYWFDASQSDRFTREWAKALTRLGLEYAHMTDCALGFGQYKQLSRDDRVLSEKLLIKCIKRRSKFGLSVTIDPLRYNEAMKDVEGAPSAYTFCLMTLVNHLGWVASSQGFAGEIRYIFESGHRSQSEANRFLNAIPKHGSRWTEAIRYGGHTFADKRESLPLQAADMLAWQTGHYFKRKSEGFDKPRKDLVALTRKYDHFIDMKPEAFTVMRDAFLELAPVIAIGDQAAASEKFADLALRHDLSWRNPPLLPLG